MSGTIGFSVSVCLTCQAPRRNHDTMQHNHAMRHLGHLDHGRSSARVISMFFSERPRYRHADSDWRITHFKYAYSRYNSMSLVVGGTITIVLQASWSAATYIRYDTI